MADLVVNLQPHLVVDIQVALLVHIHPLELNAIGITMQPQVIVQMILVFQFLLLPQIVKKLLVQD
jgi:hypothetical protein